MRAVVVYDNYEHVSGLKTAWGFSAVITTGSETILFDTGGDGDILLQNMNSLNIDPTGIKAVILSHNQWDHVGGLKTFLGVSGSVDVYIPPEFNGGFRKDIGDRCNLIDVSKPHELYPGVYVTGTVGSGIPEQAVLFQTEGSATMFTGCAHPGIVEMVEAGKRILSMPVSTVIGGFHLKDMDTSGIELVIDGLTRLGVNRIGPCHCSGGYARHAFQQRLGDSFIEVGVGTHLEF